MAESGAGLSIRRANTMVAMAFTLALLAVVVNLWVHSSTRRLLEGTLAAQERTAERVGALERKVQALEELVLRMKALEASVTAVEEKVGMGPAATGADSAPGDEGAPAAPPDPAPELVDNDAAPADSDAPE